jgi:cytoskeletal protein CcmA (bactofilin family)
MFGKTKERTALETPPPFPAEVAPAPLQESPNSKESMVAPAMMVRGDVDFEGALRIEGEVHGKITGQGRVTIDPTGRVMGDVFAAEVVVHGTVQGNVNAAARLEISASAQIAGDVKAAQLVVARGAKILGRLDIDSESMTMMSNGRERAKGPEAAPADALEKVL